MNKYESFFWWLTGYLSADNDIQPILKRMKEIGWEESTSEKDQSDCICGYNCGGDDCR